VSFAQKDYTSLVNPFIGTGGHGHTFPGASVPFGMVQLSPDTRLNGWDGASGYHYSDSLIYGFSHTHLSGTGAVDYGDILLLPFTGTAKWNSVEYASAFSHNNESASPGYYSVFLKKKNIKVELTATERAGFHRYTFPETTKEAEVLIDLQHRDEVLESSFKITSSNEIQGYRRSKAWAKDQRVYFDLKFDRPIKEFLFRKENEDLSETKFVEGKDLKLVLKFDFKGLKTLQVKVGISAISEEGARLNLNSEIPNWDFEQVKLSAKQAWNKVLGKVEVEGGTSDQQITFYTALYHTYLSPNLYQDVDGRFRSTDLQVHPPEGFVNYTVFSLWDTYRAFHPLMTILEPKRTADWIKTFLAQNKYGGMLPVWELSGNETFTMIGYHSIPVIADAWLKGIRGFDPNGALKAMTDYAESKRFGLGAYQKQGYVSNDQEPESVSKTLEYSFDDWCIAQFAKSIRNQDVYKKYIQRAQYYRNLFDVGSRHFRGKKQAQWYYPFDPSEINAFYTEGNAWQYSFAVPHDIGGMIKLFGGEAPFSNSLDSLFSVSSQTTGFKLEDVSGFIGQYAQGNEPSHHIAYLYNYIGKAWKTQELVSRIMGDFYKNSPDGLIGNEDCGQMSAWYIFSALGLYPVCPGTGEYILSSPLFDRAIVHLADGKTFTIEATHKSPHSLYINSLKLNKENYSRTFLSHADLINGGTLHFDLGDSPDLKFGRNEKDRPVTEIRDFPVLPTPYFTGSTFRFREKQKINISSPEKNVEIYYRLDSLEFKKFLKPFAVKQSASIEAYAVRERLSSNVVTQKFIRLPDATISVSTPVNTMYTAGGADALLDGILGTFNWRNGDWQSYPGDFEAVVDLRKLKKLNHVSLQVYQNSGPSILFPKEVIFQGSIDGHRYFPLGKVLTKFEKDVPEAIKNIEVEVKSKARYIKIKAINGGTIGEERAHHPSRLFISEVIVN